jgi:hypothetical protein
MAFDREEIKKKPFRVTLNREVLLPAVRFEDAREMSARHQTLAILKHQRLVASNTPVGGRRHKDAGSAFVVFLSNAGRLAFSEALLITVNIGNNPNVATPASYKAVLENVRLEKCQAQSIGRE